MAAVIFKRCTDLFLEVVNDNKIREEWDKIFDTQELAALQEVHGAFDPLALANDLLSNLEPEFLAECIVIARTIRDHSSELDSVIPQREINSRHKLRHSAVDVNSRLNALVRDAKSQGEVDVVVLLVISFLRLQVRQ